MKKLALTLTTITFALAGCHTNVAKDSTPAVASEYKAFSTQFVCDNGVSPKLTYINDSQATISIDGKTTTLDLAVSASGERYVAKSGVFGSGGEWHQKGNVAVFSYEGVHGTPAQVNCSAK